MCSNLEWKSESSFFRFFTCSIIAITYVAPESWPSTFKRDITTYANPAIKRVHTSDRKF